VGSGWKFDHSFALPLEWSKAATTHDKRAKFVSLTAMGRKRLQRASAGKGRALDERLAASVTTI